jgi:sulfopyruvate decarboxylase alpha subunit
MTDAAWPDDIFEALLARDVRHVAYVPDAGHAQLIIRAHADERTEATVLTTEEEGIALLAGAWLGGERGVLLMQSSGVGNCVNMLGLAATCRFPLVLLVTMRGEWAEFNPWQVPMSRATRSSLEGMDVGVYHVEREDEAAETVAAAGDLAFAGNQAVAVLLGQRLIGKKEWTR